MFSSLKTIQAILELLKTLATPIIDAYMKYCEKHDDIKENWYNIRTKWAGKDNIPVKISDSYRTLKDFAEKDERNQGVTGIQGVTGTSGNSI